MITKYFAIAVKKTEIKPDAVLLKFRDDNCETAPSGTSEVLLLREITDSKVDNDRDIKIPIYARSAIPEVRSIDLVENRLEIYRQPTWIQRYRIPPAIPL